MIKGLRDHVDHYKKVDEAFLIRKIGKHQESVYLSKGGKVYRLDENSSEWVEFCDADDFLGKVSSESLEGEWMEIRE